MFLVIEKEFFSQYTRVDQKCYLYNFYIWKKANHTLFMQFHKYRKLHERSMVIIFSYMETV